MQPHVSPHAVIWKSNQASLPGNQLVPGTTIDPNDSINSSDQSKKKNAIISFDY